MTINYRLGIFGFLTHPELTAHDSDGISGNYGIYDQLKALQWIRDNISQFGGDPEQITICGKDHYVTWRSFLRYGYEHHDVR